MGEPLDPLFYIYYVYRHRSPTAACAQPFFPTLYLYISFFRFFSPSEPTEGPLYLIPSFSFFSPLKPTGGHLSLFFFLFASLGGLIEKEWLACFTGSPERNRRSDLSVEAHTATRAVTE